jgi:hypothetical protein
MRQTLFILGCAVAVIAVLVAGSALIGLCVATLVHTVRSLGVQ